MADNEGEKWAAVLIPALFVAALCFLFFMIRLSRWMGDLQLSR
jgi:hypothetical protein